MVISYSENTRYHSEARRRFGMENFGRRTIDSSCLPDIFRDYTDAEFTFE